MAAAGARKFGLRNGPRAERECGMKAKPRHPPVEPWNAEAYAQSLAFDEPRNWLLVTDLEVKALIENIVPTRLKKVCQRMDQEVLTRDEAEALP